MLTSCFAFALLSLNCPPGDKVYVVCVNTVLNIYSAVFFIHRTSSAQQFSQYINAGPFFAGIWLLDVIQQDTKYIS